MSAHDEAMTALGLHANVVHAQYWLDTGLRPNRAEEVAAGFATLFAEIARLTAPIADEALREAVELMAGHMAGCGDAMCVHVDAWTAITTALNQHEAERDAAKRCPVCGREVDSPASVGKFSRRGKVFTPYWTCSDPFHNVKEATR